MAELELPTKEDLENIVNSYAENLNYIYFDLYIDLIEGICSPERLIILEIKDDIIDKHTKAEFFNKYMESIK